MTNPRTGRKSVLLVSPDEPDHLALCRFVHPPAWRVLRAQNPIEAMQVLYDAPVHAVIADSQCWKSLLAEMWNLRFPLIVADRLADERLWAEVLNLGAYDLVAKPFDGNELLHVLSSACRRPRGAIESLFHNLHGCSEGQPAGIPMQSAALAHP